MKAMITSFAFIIAIAVVAEATLTNSGFSAAEQNASDAVRLGQ